MRFEFSTKARSWGHRLAAALALTGMVLVTNQSRAGEPDPRSYWDVKDVRPGMKGIGRTVMVGTKLEQFDAEVLGVMKDVSPGRDMILCRLSGLKLEHSGIIQGMSGSPIYIDGKLLGAVAFAWEFAKDPIAGITPFSQMVQYVRSSDRKLAAETAAGVERHAALDPKTWNAEALADGLSGVNVSFSAPIPVSAGGFAGMKAISTPMAASGFSPGALALLGERLGPLGMAPMSGGAAPERIVKEEGDKPFVPGAPLSVAMVTGDFDLSAVGTVTHVEGDRVYGFGHPMFGLGACQFPLMTGYIHTVYPRASVSMKLSSPLKTVGILDTDVSTCVAGRIGPVPDMLPMTIKVKTGRYSEPRTYKVQVVREPNMMPSLVMSVLMNAIDTEGNLPEDLTARVKASFTLKGHEPIKIDDVLSGQRYSGPMGPAAIFGPVANVAGLLSRNPLAPVRIESIDAEIDIEPTRTSASIETVRLATDRVQPGQTLKAYLTLKPYKQERKTIEIKLPIPADMPEGNYDASLSDLNGTLRRRFRNEPSLIDPRDAAGILRLIRVQTELNRKSVTIAVQRPDRGITVQGQSLPNLPASVRAVFSTPRQTPEPPIRADIAATVETPWVIEGSQSIRFTVTKDLGLSSATPL